MFIAKKLQAEVHIAAPRCLRGSSRSRGEKKEISSTKIGKNLKKWHFLPKFQANEQKRGKEKVQKFIKFLNLPFQIEALDSPLLTGDIRL